MNDGETDAWSVIEGKNAHREIVQCFGYSEYGQCGEVVLMEMV